MSGGRTEVSTGDVLGNADAFVHAHIWPGYECELPSLVIRPVWLYAPDRWRDPQTALGAQHAGLRARIMTELGVLGNEDTVRISG